MTGNKRGEILDVCFCGILDPKIKALRPLHVLLGNVTRSFKAAGFAKEENKTRNFPELNVIVKADSPLQRTFHKTKIVFKSRQKMRWFGGVVPTPNSSGPGPEVS